MDNGFHAHPVHRQLGWHQLTVKLVVVGYTKGPVAHGWRAKPVARAHGVGRGLGVVTSAGIG
jgi:hypothetical protein